MEIFNRTNTDPLPIDENRLETLADDLLCEFYEGPLPEVTLAFVEPDEIRALNAQFRFTDEVTDVLSFPADGEVNPDTNIEFLGDLVVCLDRASEQADQGGHTLQDEVALLTIHGLLHLLGYDHGDPEEKEEMWELQDEFIQKNGLKLGRISGDEPF